MSNETMVTLIGKLYGDPEVRFLPDGGSVANLVIIVNARKFNKQTSEWEQKPGKFWRCSAWNQGKMELASNVADMLKDKDSVIAYGELVTREYEQDGKKRTADEVRIETIGKDLRWHSQPATPQQGESTGNSTGPSAHWNAPAQDPWASSTAPAFGGQDDSEPPF